MPRILLAAFLIWLLMRGRIPVYKALALTSATSGADGASGETSSEPWWSKSLFDLFSGK